MQTIADRSDGILETHVQWKDIEEKMQEALGTSATFGPEKTVKHIGEGNGFMSRVCLIHPDWQNGSDDLPKAFIAKICSALTLIDYSRKSGNTLDVTALIAKVLEICVNVHNIEVKTYKILEKYSAGRIPMPKIYGSTKFSDENKTKGFLIMEHFDNVVPCHVMNNIGLGAAKKILRSIAIWQSIGLKMTDEERKFFSTTFYGDNFAGVYSKPMVEQYRKGLIEFCGDEHLELIEKFFLIMNELIDPTYFQKLDSVSDKIGNDKVFCHGDLWSTNILFSKTDGVYDIISLIDFQTASFNSPAVDIGRFFAACLSGEDRRQHAEELLETFYEYLLEETEGYAPYTLEQLKESYAHLAPMYAFLVVPMFDSLSKYLRKEHPEMAEMDQEVINKTIALMEDGLKYHASHPIL